MASNRRNGSKSKSHAKPKSNKPAPAASARSTPTNATTAPSFTGSTGHTRAVEAKPTRIEINQQTVAEAAYYLWLRRGGDDISNWLEAERQLRQGTFAR
jgi:hypothetical protein